MRPEYDRHPALADLLLKQVASDALTWSDVGKRGVIWRAPADRR